MTRRLRVTFDRFFCGIMNQMNWKLSHWKVDAMRLDTEEKEWLDRFVDELSRRFPEAVDRVIVFGSKARGDADSDSDLDVLVVATGDEKLKTSIRILGYELALRENVVPSIVVYTSEEFEQRRQNRSVFIESVERDGVVVC